MTFPGSLQLTFFPVATKKNSHKTLSVVYTVLRVEGIGIYTTSVCAFELSKSYGKVGNIRFQCLFAKRIKQTQLNIRLRSYLMLFLSTTEHQNKISR